MSVKVSASRIPNPVSPSFVVSVYGVEQGDEFNIKQTKTAYVSSENIISAGTDIHYYFILSGIPYEFELTTDETTSTYEFSDAISNAISGGTANYDGVQISFTTSQATALSEQLGDLWCADEPAKIVARQNSQSSSFSMPISTKCLYLAALFESGLENITANSIKSAFIDFFENANTQSNTVKVSQFQLLGLGDISSVNPYMPGNIKFDSTLECTYKVQFVQKKDFPTDSVTELFDCNKLSAKVNRHNQQTGSSCSLPLLNENLYYDHGTHVAVLIVKLSDSVNNNVTDDDILTYFADGLETSFIIKSVQNMGMFSTLLTDTTDSKFINTLNEYYNINLVGTNKMKLSQRG